MVDIAGSLHRDLTPETLEEGLRQVFTDSMDIKAEPMQATSKNIFNFLSSRKANEDFQKVSGVGLFDAVDEEDDTPTVARKEIAKTTFSHSTFRKGIKVTYEQLADQLYNEMRDHTTQLGIAARTTQEINRFGVIRNITTTAGSDGEALASTAHPLLGGATQSNLVTGATTKDKLEEMINLMREQLDQNSKPFLSAPKDWLTSAQNHSEVLELTQSKLRAGTANNDLNYFSEVFPGTRVLFTPLIGTVHSGSDTGVTLIGTAHRMNTVIREQLKTWMTDWKEDAATVTKFMALYRESVGFADYVGVVHGAGA